MTTTAQREHDRSGPYRVLGTRPIRHDGLDKVTGAAKYGADIQFPGMLHGMILRSPHAHARIRSIDVSKAAALPGVRAVATAAGTEFRGAVEELHLRQAGQSGPHGQDVGVWVDVGRLDPEGLQELRGGDIHRA